MRPKVSLRSVITAQKRAAGLRSINADLDLGNGLTLKAFDTAIEAMITQVSDYNQALSEVDAQRLMINDSERKLRDLSERMLEGVSVRFTKDSEEYGRAGGVRKMDRKRPIRRQVAVSNVVKVNNELSTN